MRQEPSPFISICYFLGLFIGDFEEFFKWRLFANLWGSDEGFYMMAVALRAENLRYMMHGSAELYVVAMKCALWSSR